MNIFKEMEKLKESKETSECNVCYNESKRLKKCFWGCSFNICYECISKIIKLSSFGVISYKCPMCGKSSYNTRNNKIEDIDLLNKQQIANYYFGRVCKRNEKVISRIYEIYEDKINEAPRIHTIIPPIITIPPLEEYQYSDLGISNDEILNVDTAFDTVLNRFINTITSYRDHN